jgi:hypothetical protein
MQTLLISLLMLTSTGSDQTGLKESRGLIMPFYVSKTEADLNLPKDIAVLNMHFSIYAGDGVLKNTVKFKVDGCDTVTPVIDSLGYCKYAIAPGKHKIDFYRKNCTTVTSDSIIIEGQTKVDMNVFFQNPNIIMVVCKPVIYLYPQQTANVHIDLNSKGELGMTYPLYNKKNGWNVTADANGTITSDNKTYNYLFWDGTMEIGKFNFNANEGSIVESVNLISFLENTLTQIGMNSKESADFITYWAPKMLKNKKNFIHFMVNDNYEQIASVNVSPKPDNMLRVYMMWGKVDEENELNPTPQSFQQLKREGFTYIEWGGSEFPAVKGM